jgi:hypothetical protein
MKNKILFTYNPWKYYESYKNTLHNVRKYYPESDIIIFFDKSRTDLDSYLETAKVNNCKVFTKENELGYINRNDSTYINLPKQFEWISRMKFACETSESEWVMLLEDDVLLKREILHWPNSDCGKNRHDVGFCGGGSIFKRKKFLEIFEIFSSEDIKNIIQKNHDYSWAGDALLKYLFIKIGASHEKWIELAEPNYYDNTDHAIYHGYKDLHKLG